MILQKFNMHRANVATKISIKYWRKCFPSLGMHFIDLQYWEHWGNWRAQGEILPHQNDTRYFPCSEKNLLKIMTDEIHKAFVSLKQGGRNEMSSFHYVNFAGSLQHLMNCYSICRWTLPTRSPQIWHTVITCPIFLCCIMSSTAHRNTAHKAETKVPEEFNLSEVISVSSFQARIHETHCCPFGPVAQTKQVYYCILALAFTFGATELAMKL